MTATYNNPVEDRFRMILFMSSRTSTSENNRSKKNKKGATEGDI